jgi:hypothetical protein
MSLRQEIEMRMLESKRNMCVHYTLNAFSNAKPKNKIDQKIWGDNSISDLIQLLEYNLREHLYD